MAMTWDLSDVPTVEADDLTAIMRALIEKGRGLVLLRGLEDEDLSTAQAEIKRRFHGEPQQAVAVFVRFRMLIEVFAARRLQDLMMDRGHALMAPAVAIAASLRLNANRGFNPQRFVLSLREMLDANVVVMESHTPAAAQEVDLPLAA
jgi:hypothetical protein